LQVAGEWGADMNLDPTVWPFRVEPGVADITVQVRWVDTLYPPRRRQLFDSGCIWRLHENSSGLQFDFGARAGGTPYKRLLVDDRFRVATLFLSREFFTNRGTAVPLEYPLDELLIMHRLTQERAIELHGSGIVRANGVGNLFVGHSGAGKSTTTRLWTEREDVEVLSDDRIIVRPDEPKKTLLPGDSRKKEEILRPHDDSASQTHYSAQGDREKATGMRMYGTPWHGEAMFASPNSAPLTRIFVLEHGHANVITRLSRSQAVAELFARSFVPFHRHEYIDSALSFLEQLADSVPCYRYSFEPDHFAVDKIRHFHD
jgi:hypothetical protein